MIPSLPRPAWLRAGTAAYAVAFFAFLFLPLVVVAVFAFNDAPYPAPPWRGFTLDWFGGGKDSLWFTEQIYTQFITRFNWEQGAAFGFLLLGLSTAIVWAGLAASGQKFGDVMRRG